MDIESPSVIGAKVGELWTSKIEYPGRDGAWALFATLCPTLKKLAGCWFFC
jgi:hypothetical protein